MVEEIDDSGFYREDFTAKSDWEVFNAQLCELFQKWELSNTDWGNIFQPNELYECDWKIEEESLNVKGNEVLVTYYEADLNSQDNKIAASAREAVPIHQDLLSLNNTFGPPVSEQKSKNIHWLARFYGLRRFVVLNPHTNQNDFITKRSEFSFYFSAISVVAAEIAAAVPMFVQIYDPRWNFFLGLGINSYMRTNFDVVALEQSPPDHCYLSGLLKMFKEKVPKHCKQPALVSVRNTYTLNTIKISAPMYKPFDMMKPLSEGSDPFSEDRDPSIISISNFVALPHGFCSDSRTEMFAMFTWPELTDNMVIDSAIQTQFVPSKAHCAAIHQVVHATSFLSSCLKCFHNLSSPLEFENPLAQLSKSSLESFQAYRLMKRTHEVAPTTLPKNLPGPIYEHELNAMLRYLFPDLHTEISIFPYNTMDFNKDPHRIKSAAVDSLVHRLSCLLATCYAHFDRKRGLAQLWAAFVIELRILWDRCTIVPGVAPGLPDIKTCLLHQKLQMLNVCMQRRLERDHFIEPRSHLSESEEILTEEEDTDYEEEFYDCYENESNRSSSPVIGEVATRPEGRLKRLRNLKLLDTDEYLYVPITQELTPKTEDQLQNATDVMLELGSDSEHVTGMMCSTLKSDVEAFKAANLNAKFEDFIRWYSPNDWKEYTDEEGVQKYELSARMSAKNNVWQTVWEQAKPVPITRQERFFNDTSEGERVLNYLETRNVGEIYGLTVVPLLHSAIVKLKDIFNNSKVLELFSENLNEIQADLSRFSRDVEIVAGSSSSTAPSDINYVLQLPNPQPILNKIEQLETQFYQYKCLESIPELANVDVTQIQTKFKEILRNEGCCTITPARTATDANQDTIVEKSLMASFEGDMSKKLTTKEYVIRMGEGITKTAESCRDNNDENIVMPQFLRAIVRGEQLRLCGAFTENTAILE